MCQVAVRFGVDPVQPGAHDRERDGLAGAADGFKCALMGRTVNAQCQAADHAQAGLRQRLGKPSGIDHALRSRVAAAHHGQTGSGIEQPLICYVINTYLCFAGKHFKGIFCKTTSAQQVQHQGRIVQIEQHLRIVRVTQGGNPAADWRVLSVLQPGPGAFCQRLQGVGRSPQGQRLGAADMFAQRACRLSEYGLRQAEGPQQLACTDVADARCQGQAQPGGEFVTFHSVPGAGCALTWVNAGWSNGRQP
ncbi:hypothetical protein GALL_474320 [mine drainage metagenome]|uniref:Uncharacterized protein n=1 Tax=mine drainage metagenome TaxID=410659 RepID=A0A1J5PJH2_9ZZZZ